MSDRNFLKSEKPPASIDRRARRRAAKSARIIAEAWSLAQRGGLAGFLLPDLADVETCIIDIDRRSVIEP